MSGVLLEIHPQGLAQTLAKLDALGGWRAPDLLEDIGAVLESGARRRLSEEKAGPEGDLWVEWSQAYAPTREAHHSLLEGEGDLRDSIASYHDGSAVMVGSNMIYAAIHQLGGEAGRRSARVHIPARPYLGMSDDDAAEISSLIEARIEDLLQ